MADEFIKGLVCFTGGMFGWLVFAGWYNTSGFESTQLVGTAPSSTELYGTVALTLKHVLLWFAILSAITFWVLIPAARELRSFLADRRSN